MNKNARHFKFINNETDNVIYFLSIPRDKADYKRALESTRHKLAVENGIYIGSIYYMEETEKDDDK